MEEKIIKNSFFVGNPLRISVPKVQVLGTKEENGEKKYFIHMNKDKSISGWYSSFEAKKLGINLQD